MLHQLQLSVTSNHKVIKMTVELRDMGLDQQKKSKFQLKKIDKKRFTKTLLTKKDFIQVQLRLAKPKHPKIYHLGKKTWINM